MGTDALGLPNTQRLLTRLDTATINAAGDLTPILFCAPAGFGKTKLLAAWLDSQPDARVIRMRCYRGSSDDFWAGLRYVLSEALPGEMVATDTPWPVLIRTLAELDAPLTLVIEDYHLVTTREVDLTLLDLVGPKLQLVIIARRVSVLDGPLAASRSAILLLAPRHLALTPDEGREQAFHRFNARPGASTDSALELAGGWPLAIRAAFTAAGPAPGQAESNTTFVLDPLAALTRFAQHQLESLDEPGKAVLLASTVIDVIDVRQAAELLDATREDALCTVHGLLELGLLIPAPSGDTEEFTCHPVIRHGISSRACTDLPEPQRTRLVHSRAERISAVVPLTAFRMYLSIGAYSDAEIVLAQHFNTITDEQKLTEPLLRLLSTATLEAHPLFIAARLFYDLANPSRSRETLRTLIGMWGQSLQQVMDSPERPSPLILPDRLQQMIAARFAGELRTASRIAHELEARMDVTQAFETSAPQSGYGARRALGSGSLPIYYQELATTALLTGEIDRARRLWQRLRAHAEYLIAYPWIGFPSASERTVSDVESGRQWLLATLYELAFTDIMDGDVNTARATLQHADDLSETLGIRGPRTSWINGEIARANLSFELGDPALLERAERAVEPYEGRFEQWPWFLLAETTAILQTRGPSWALQHFDAGIAELTEKTRPIDFMQDILTGHRTVFTTLLGRFAESDAQLATMPEGATITLLERGRRELFAGNDAQAVLLVREISDAQASRRQQLQRCLILACAAWSAGRAEDAFDAFQRATALLEQNGLTSALSTVPYAVLADVAVAAQQAGVVDAVARVATVPEPARARRFEPLTEMELRTLQAVAAHGTTNETAEALFVTPATVKKHLNAVYRKLDVTGREDAILLAADMGLLEHRS